MSQRKEKYLRRALNEANRLEGAAVSPRLRCGRRFWSWPPWGKDWSAT